MAGTDGPDGDPVRERWDDVIADTEATAREYEDRGWEALALHPGDVTPLAGGGVERRGFDVLLPDGEFDDLLGLIEAGADFDAYEVYATSEGGVVFLVVAMRDAETGTAVVFPIYYRQGDGRLAELRAHAGETGVVKSHLRRLAEDEVVTFAHDDPELFL